MSDQASQKAQGRSGFLSRTISSLTGELFTIDVRSLAALRIGLALLILIDLANRLSTLELFYTGDGILKGSDAYEFLGSGYWSLYWSTESMGITKTLFAINAVAAIGLLVGFQTRVMTIICLVFAWSLQICNPLVLTAGHILLRMMLLWAVFLPLNSMWSFDSSRRRPSHEGPKHWRVTSVAAAGIMLQLAFVYFFSGLAKLNPDWFSGIALEQALNLEMYVKPLGESLTQYPAMLKYMSFATLGLELAIPLLMFVPRISSFFRGLGMACFWLLHLGIFLSMSIGIFSLVAMVSWAVFLPSEFWNSILGEPTGYEESKPRRSTFERKLATALACLVLIFITAMNIANVDRQKSASWFGSQARHFARRTMTVQQFKMFGELPKRSPWFEYRGQLANGEHHELFSNKLLAEGEKPASVYEQMKSQHWRRLHFNLINGPERAWLYGRKPESYQPSEVHDRIRQRLLEAIVDHWNGYHPGEQKVASAKLILHLDPIVLDSKDGTEVTLDPISRVWAEYRATDRTE